MIKDRVIQKRIKGKVLAMAMTAVVASFFVPLGVEAAQTVQTSQRAGNGNGNLILTDEGYYWEKAGIDTITSCGTSGCEGHTITGTGTDSVEWGIKVESGKHDIIMNNVNIDLSNITDDAQRPSALDIGKKAEVNLTLKGNNTLTSARTRAGIAVPDSASLTIKEGEPGASLTVSSPYGGAGIGGDGVADTVTAGNITIESGTIKATGGAGGAGGGGRPGE